MGAERVISFRPRTILSLVGLLLAIAAALWVVYAARQVLTWVLVSAFLALVLNPAVEWLQCRRGLQRRGVAVGVVFLAAFAGLAGLGFAFIPPLVDQVNQLVDATPGYVEDLTRGEGPLGFLQRDFDVVDRVQEAVDGGAAEDISGGAGTVLSVTEGIVTVVIAIVTITFMTLFMLLEGPTWLERFFSLLPHESEQRWRAVGGQISETVSGYVRGNLLISLIAGITTSIVLAAFGVPYALALGLLVGVLDLIPLAGATLAGIIVITLGFLTSTTAGIGIAIFVVLYQQIENHILQPIIYGKTVQLSPLAVLISVLIGAEVAGVLGALGAIPIAGTLQILLVDWRAHRRGLVPPPGAPPVPPGADAEDAPEPIRPAAVDPSNGAKAAGP